MESNITLVSDPDSFVGGDLRLFLAGVSDAKMLDLFNYFSTQTFHTVIHSVTTDNYDWVFKTAQSCDKIIIDLDNYNNLGAGWLLRDKKTVWYGNLNIESLVNNKIVDPLSFTMEYTKGNIF